MNNTTDDLVNDVEDLRQMLEIDQWLVFGGSWGSTLGLVYAESHPQRCLGLILRGVFMGRQKELDWFLTGIRHIYPEVWQNFAEFIPVEERDDLAKAYYKRLIDENSEVHGPAAAAWNHYESQCSTLRHRPLGPPKGSSMVSLALARLEAHYFVNQLFLEENQILNNLGKIASLPIAIIQGRYDMICPIISANLLADSHPRAVINVINDAGHSAMEPGIRCGLVEATNIFRDKGHF